MKEYFKYANGYVNINDEYLYLTNSGNWSEIVKLEEKSPKTIRINNFKSFKIYLYYGLVLIMLLFFFFGIVRDFENKTFPIGIIVLTLAGIKYMDNEKGKRYKIPLSKIQNFEISEHSVKINFLNLNNEKDFETINKVEERGITVLNDLNLQLKK